MDAYKTYPPKDHRIPKDEEEWFRFRREGFDPTHPLLVTLGGSDVGKIFLAERGNKDFKYFITAKARDWLGESKAAAYLSHLNQETSFSPLIELFLEKSSALCNEPFYIKKKISNDAVDTGHLYEPFVARRCEMTFDCKIDAQPGAYQHGHPDYDFIIANPDGIIDSFTGTIQTIGGDLVSLENEKVIWEGKTLNPSNKSVVKDWKRAIVPFKYELQTRLYMSTLDINYCVISCAWGLQKEYTAHVLIVRDLEIEQYMLKRIREFRDDVISSNIPPLDGTVQQKADVIKRDIRRLSNKSTTALLPPVLYGQAAQQLYILQAKRDSMATAIKQIDEQIDACKNDLLVAMGPAANGIVRVGKKTYKIKVSRYNHAIVTQKELEAKYPGAWDECKSTTPVLKASVKMDTDNGR